MLVKNPPDQLPYPQSPLDWQLFLNGVMGLLFGFIGFVVLAWLSGRYLPRLEFLSGLILAPAVAKKGDEYELCQTGEPEAVTINVSLGDIGEVVSTLRPVGEAKFGNIIVDVVAVAEFLEKGTRVKVIQIHGNRVVVKNIENQS